MSKGGSKISATDVDHVESEEKKATSLVPHGCLPSYLSEAFGDLYEEDGLVVLGKGMGMLPLLASFCRFYADPSEVLEDKADSNKQSKKRPLVLIIGWRGDGERESVMDILQSWGTPPSLLPQWITNDKDAKERSRLYQRGGLFGITSRILIVDLLTGVCQAEDVDGILVCHAEAIAGGDTSNTNSTTEAFILRIFVTQKQLANQTYFVKAFSESPAELMSGFSKVDKVLKALYVRRLYLYPRFQSSVADELDQMPPEVIELHQKLSPRMKEIQTTIAVAIQTCVRELKNACPQVDWSSSEELSSIENCVTQAFDRAISRQLQPEWHRLRPATKQLVQDMRNLRMLFFYLLHYDCVSFYKILQTFKTLSASSRNPSMWLLTPAADQLFRLAKQRLYKLELTRSTKQIPQPVARLVPVLEENPKWQLVHQLLKEIRGEEHGDAATILIMVKDKRTLENLRSYLVEGRERTMTQKWWAYLEQVNDRSRSVAKTTGGTSAISEESRLLLEEESRARSFLFGDSGKGKQSTSKASKKQQKLNQVPAHVRKRRKIASEQSRGERGSVSKANPLDEAVDDEERDLKRHAQASKVDNILDDEDGSDHEDDDDGVSWYRVSALSTSKVLIKSYTSLEGEQAHLMLQDVEPSHIILYDANLEFVRSIEIHSCLREANRLPRVKVYITLFEASAEEKIFLKSVEREQNAFERLIHHKKTMPLPVYTLSGTTQEMQLALGSAVGTYAGGTLPLAFDTRTGRGKAKPDTERRDIAVDVREFRSALPSILHQGGMRLAPVTLTVGDFVLSNVHCVERKSISDLFGSFASGRLFTQAESMSKYYKCPCLLIEFEPSKAFSLQNSNELGVEIRNDSISSKMVLLTMHFPKLRILWSRSPHETLRIFKELKAKHEEVNVDKAVEIGRNESIDEFMKENSNEDGDEDEINEVARDMLLRLPGVNVHNARKIMKECDSLAELSQLPRDRLRDIAGPVTGQKLFTFFRQKMGSV